MWKCFFFVGEVSRLVLLLRSETTTNTLHSLTHCLNAVHVQQHKVTLTQNWSCFCGSGHQHRSEGVVSEQRWGGVWLRLQTGSGGFYPVLEPSCLQPHYKNPDMSSTKYTCTTLYLVSKQLWSLETRLRFCSLIRSSSWFTVKFLPSGHLHPPAVHSLQDHQSQREWHQSAADPGEPLPQQAGGGCSRPGQADGYVSKDILPVWAAKVLTTNGLLKLQVHVKTSDRVTTEGLSGTESIIHSLWGRSSSGWWGCCYAHNELTPRHRYCRLIETDLQLMETHLCSERMGLERRLTQMIILIVD